MSLILIDQFDEWSEAYPEMTQCYDFRYDSDTKDADDEEDYDPTTDPEDEYFAALRWMEVL